MQETIDMSWAAEEVPYPPKAAPLRFCRLSKGRQLMILSQANGPESPIALASGICLKRYREPFYSSRSTPQFRDVGPSGGVDTFDHVSYYYAGTGVGITGRYSVPELFLTSTLPERRTLCDNRLYPPSHIICPKIEGWHGV